MKIHKNAFFSHQKNPISKKRRRRKIFSAQLKKRFSIKNVEAFSELFIAKSDDMNLDIFDSFIFRHENRDEMVWGKIYLFDFHARLHFWVVRWYWALRTLNCIRALNGKMIPLNYYFTFLLLANDNITFHFWEFYISTLCIYKFGAETWSLIGFSCFWSLVQKKKLLENVSFFPFLQNMFLIKHHFRYLLIFLYSGKALRKHKNAFSYQEFWHCSRVWHYTSK